MSRDAVDVGLFVTCLVDLFRPGVGFAAVKLLETAGCRVYVPENQTCCGQPAFNSGDFKGAADIARDVIAAFEDFDCVVVPSGSCTAQIKIYFPELLASDPAWSARAEALAEKTWELVSFLVNCRGVEAVDASHQGTVTYHDSCSGLRELGVKEQPRKLLGSIVGLSLSELEGAEECCGFGGTFCVKYPEVSGKIVGQKTEAVAASGAQTLLAGDLGCLLNMAGKLSRENSDVEVRHVAEVLAGESGPAIGRG